jgi:hypothetical protein
MSEFDPEKALRYQPFPDGLNPKSDPEVGIMHDWPIEYVDASDYDKLAATYVELLALYREAVSEHVPIHYFDPRA